jgi:hypothetical protein
MLIFDIYSEKKPFSSLDYVITEKKEEKEKATIKAHLFISIINILQ